MGKAALIMISDEDVVRQVELDKLIGKGND